MSERERLIAALHAHLDGETLSLTDAEDVIDLLEDDARGRDGAFVVLPLEVDQQRMAELIQLRKIVRALAATDVLVVDPDDRRFHCALCGNGIWSIEDHEPDCLWLQARAVIEAKP